MRVLFFAIFAALVPLIAGGTTLDEAKQIAIENSPHLKASDAAVTATKASLIRLNSPFFPHLGVETRYEYFDSEFEMLKGGTSNLFAEWNIFNGFQDYAARKAQSLALQSARLQNELAKKKIVWEVETSFANVVSQQETIRFFNEAIQRNEANKKSARARRAAGVVSDADVLEFELYESILRAEHAAAEGNLRQAQARFRTVLGVEDVAFPVVGSIPRYKLQSDLPDLIKRLPESNVELRASELNVKRANAQKNVATGSFLPEVKLFASYGSLGLRETEINPETYAGVVARWELFSGLDSWGARREAVAGVAQAEAELKLAQVSKKGELEQTYSKLKALEYRLDLENRNHETAHKYLRTVSDEYRRGVKNSPDLKDANDHMLQTHLREVELASEAVELVAELNAIMNDQVSFEKLKSELRRDDK